MIFWSLGVMGVECLTDYLDIPVEYYNELIFSILLCTKDINNSDFL
jgi:hypothetical protein